MNGHYETGDVVLGNWKLQRLIGEGSYGKVYEAIREDFGITYKAAIKIITIPQSDSEVKSARAEGMDDESVTAYFRGFVEELVQEFVLMSKLKGNSNVVSYEDHTVIEHDNGVGWDIIIRMELLTPLLDYVQSNQLTRKDVTKLGIDICKALELCQKYNIVHRDIKPENIFVSELGDFKLGDFGIARTVEKTTGGLSKKGTYTYMAPEVYKEEPYNSNVDIYSLGIVMYRLLNENRAPFLPAYPAPIMHSDRENALAKRLSGAKMPGPKNADGRLAEIVLKACAYQPKDRYSSPMQMEHELEAILYDRSEAAIIYPEGDEAPIKSIENIPTDSPESAPKEGTASVFGSHNEAPAGDGDLSSSTATIEPEKTESVFSGNESDAHEQQSGKKKSKKVPIIAACAIVAVLLGVLALGGGGSKRGSSQVARSDTEDAEKGSTVPSDGSQSDDEVELPALGETFESLLWGSYTFDEFVEKSPSSYRVDLDVFMKGMKYEMLGDKEVSCVPFEISNAGPLWSGTKSELEEMRQDFLQEYDEKYWDNYLALLQMSSLSATYCDKLGNIWYKENVYKVEGNKLLLAVDGEIDENTFEFSASEWREYQFSFDGWNLIMLRNKCRVEMVPYRFSKETVYQNWGQYFGGYIASDEYAYNEISHIYYSHDGAAPVDDYMLFIQFTDGGHVSDPVIEINETGEFSIHWEKVWRPYNGRNESLEQPGSIAGQLIVCGGVGTIYDRGCIMIIDNHYYLYQSTHKQYNESKLSDVLDESVSISDLSDTQIDALVTTQASILNDLDRAFNDADIAADIDANTGKVTMDASILFAYDDATLSDVGKAYLDGFLDVYSSVVLNDKYSGAISEILVEGHTDTSGSYDYNMTLSEQRAQSVVDYCLSKQPQLTDFIVARGCSSDNPIYDDAGNVDMEASRRVVFKFILTVS